MTQSEIIKTNFSTVLNGRTFKFKNVKLDKVTYNGGIRFYAPMGTVSSVVRQYVKQRWPQVGKFNISSDSYSMGDSVTVYLNFVDKELYSEINSELSMLFQRGHFDGMTDMYEYSNKNRMSVPVSPDESTNATIDTKWMSVNNRPKFGSSLWKEADTKGLV